jgi:hypothetical protein
VPPPIVTDLAPAEGPITGGTPILIEGQHLETTIEVTFGGAAASQLSVASDTALEVTTPPGESGAGPVDVTVTTAHGTATLSGGFAYFDPAPVVTDLSPDEGSTIGGTRVTITGRRLEETVEVAFGDVSAADLDIESDTRLRATAPRREDAPGSVDVTITTRHGAARLERAFTYLDPEVTSLDWTIDAAGRITLSWELTAAADEIVVYRGREPLTTLDGDALSFSYDEEAIGVFRETVGLFVGGERVDAGSVTAHVGWVLWDAPRDGDIDGYYIYVAENPDPLLDGRDYSFNARSTRKLALRELYDAGVVRGGRTYRLALSSHRDKQISDHSEPVEFTYTAATARP